VAADLSDRGVGSRYSHTEFSRSTSPRRCCSSCSRPCRGSSSSGRLARAAIARRRRAGCTARRVVGLAQSQRGLRVGDRVTADRYHDALGLRSIVIGGSRPAGGSASRSSWLQSAAFLRHSEPMLQRRRSGRRRLVGFSGDGGRSSAAVTVVTGGRSRSACSAGPAAASGDVSRQRRDDDSSKAGC